MFGQRIAIAMVVLCAVTCTLRAENAPAAAPPQNKRIHGLFALEFLNTYYYRGFLQENEGVIAQPAFRVDVDLLRGEQGLQNVSAIAGIRASLHSEQTAAMGNGPDIWYEADLVAGLGFRLFDRWNLETKYVSITSPNGAFGTINEIDVDLGFDDSGLWPGDFSIRPNVMVAFELDGSAAGQQEGILMELSAEPGFMIVQSQSFPVRLSFPVKAGISLDDYYVLPFGGEDDTFGYLKAGVSLTFPLMFVPPDLGQWAIIGGVDWMYLGDNTRLFNMGDETDVILRIGVGARF